MKYLGIEPKRPRIARLRLHRLRGLRAAARQQGGDPRRLPRAPSRSSTSARSPRRTSDDYDDRPDRRRDHAAPTRSSGCKRSASRPSVLVALGSCACFGGVNRLKNAFDLDEANREVYGDHPKETLPTRAVKEVVAGGPGDPRLPGLQGRGRADRPAPGLGRALPASRPTRSAWSASSASRSACSTRGSSASGRSPAAGCNAPCPAGGLGCWGCRGPAADPNYEEFLAIARRARLRRATRSTSGSSFFGGFEGVAMKIDLNVDVHHLDPGRGSRQHPRPGRERQARGGPLGRGGDAALLRGDAQGQALHHGRDPDRADLRHLLHRPLPGQPAGHRERLRRRRSPRPRPSCGCWPSTARRCRATSCTSSSWPRRTSSASPASLPLLETQARGRRPGRAAQGAGQPPLRRGRRPHHPPGLAPGRRRGHDARPATAARRCATSSTRSLDDLDGDRRALRRPSRSPTSRARPSSSRSRARTTTPSSAAGWSRPTASSSAERDYLAMTNEYVDRRQHLQVVQALARVLRRRRPGPLQQQPPSCCTPRRARRPSALGLAPVCHNPFMNNVAQLVECVHVRPRLDPPDRRARSASRPAETHGPGDAPGRRRASARSRCRAASSTTTTSTTTTGRIVRANCVIPTTQNNANIHHDLQRLVEQLRRRRA